MTGAEKENINTLEEPSEFFLTMYSGMAQEELISMSKNITKGFEMKRRRGEANFQYHRLYAYKEGADGEPEIIPEQAEIVRRIYRLYLMGESLKNIAEVLNCEGVTTVCSGEKWSDNSIRSILENEKYCGDVILGKTYVESPLTKKVKKNNGERPKVYIKNNHDAIVPREIFEQVQAEKSRRKSIKKSSKKTKTELGKHSSMYALKGILICGDCGTEYSRQIWTKRDKSK